MYRKSHPGTDELAKQLHPSTRGDPSADWRRSMCPTPLTHLVVKFPTPGKEKRSSPPWSPVGGGGGGGGGGVPQLLQLIGS